MHSGIGPSSLSPALGLMGGGGRGAQPPAPPAPDPLAIFGSSSPGLLYWGRADTVTESGGVVSALPNKATYGPSSLAQGTSSKRPALITYAGLPALRFDGTDDLLTGTIPGGGTAARCCMWMVARAHTLRATTDYYGIVHNNSGGYLAPVRQTTTHFTGFINSNGGDIVTGPTRDTAVHLFVAAFEAQTLGRYRVDGKRFNGLYTGTPPTLDQITIGAWLPTASNWAAADIFEIGFVNLVPTEEQYAALDAYVRERYQIMLDNTLALDRISVAALGAYSFSRKARAGWTEYAYEVQRTSDGVVAPVGFVGNAANTAAVTAHVGAGNGKVYTLRDQGPSGRHLNVGGASGPSLPHIATAGVVKTMSNGCPAGFTSAIPGTSEESLSSQVNAFGIVGNPAFTIGIAFARTFSEGRTFEYGGAAVTPDSFLVDAEITRGMFVSNRSANRQFNYDTSAGLPHAMVIRKPLNATLADVNILESGAQLTQLAIVSGTQTFNFSNTSTRLTLWNHRGGNDSFGGYIAAFFFFPAYFADGSADLEALVEELEAHIAPPT